MNQHAPAVEPVLHFEPGMCWEFGPLQLSEAEIIDFAQRMDPLPIHTDPAFAAQSRFRGLIASGLHPFTALHLRYWNPLTAPTIVCGIRLDSQFHKPVYADMPFTATLSIERTQPNPGKGTVVVEWCWLLHDLAGTLLQTTSATTLHRLP